MFKYYFEQVNNVEIWPIMSLIIFICFFIGLLIWVVMVDKKYIQEMSNMPMNDTDKNDNQFDHV